MDLLHKDLLFEIFMYFDIQTLLNCALVNKQFNIAYHNDQIWKYHYDNKDFIKNHTRYIGQSIYNGKTTDYDMYKQKSYYESYKYVHQIIMFEKAIAAGSGYICHGNSTPSCTFYDTTYANLIGCQKITIGCMFPDCNISFNNTYDNTINYLKSGSNSLNKYSTHKIYNKQKLNTEIRFFPKAITNLTALETLIINDTGIFKIPKEIGKLINLQKLVLTNSKVMTIDKNISKLVNLTHIDLSNNYIYDMSILESFESLTRLTCLDLGNNQIDNIDYIPPMKNLTTLELYNNDLTTLPSSISNLTNLKSLNLKHNSITQLPKELAHMTELHHLNIADNQLSELPVFLSFSNIRKISHYNNKITSIPVEFKHTSIIYY